MSSYVIGNMKVSSQQPHDAARVHGNLPGSPFFSDGKDRRREDHRVRTLVTMGVDGLLVVGRDDGIVWFANPAAADLLGRPYDELIGAPFGTPVSPGES